MNYSHYDIVDWLSLRPLKFQLKEFRNDLCCSVYTRRKYISVNKYAAELLRNNSGRIDSIYLTISFEVPEIIEMQIKSLKKNDPDPLYIVADNSCSSMDAKKIAAICDKYKVPYFKLPKNKSRSNARSHSYALQWSYENIIKVLQPKRFGFLDHDVFLTKKLSPFITMQKQSLIAYGLRLVGVCHKKFYNKDHNPSWFLWPGFCFYEYDKVSDKNLYFMYDFSLGSDTGGRNYDRIYRDFEQEIGFCDFKHLNISDTGNYNIDVSSSIIVKGWEWSKIDRDFDLFDDSWVHYRGAIDKGMAKDKNDKLLFYIGSDMELPECSDYNLQTKS